MPERIAQHQVADAQSFGAGGHPRRDSHCLPNALVGSAGGFEMVDERDAVEAAGLRDVRTLDDRGDVQPHLRQEQKPFGH